MLEARELVVSFGALRAVDAVTLSFPSDGISGLIGPNGAGKTTLFNALAGAVKPARGEVHFAGRRIDRLRPDQVFAAGLARTFQIPRPFPEMSVIENVMLAAPGQPGERFWNNWLRPRRVREAEDAIRRKAEELIEFVALGALAASPAKSLSGGQRKLLELARVMMGGPRYILLDEPAAGVNPALLETIVERIRLLNRAGVGFLVIEHNMDVIASLCDPVIAMAQGRVIAQGRPEQVRGDQAVIDAYLGDTP
jgi:ABC-type branched-subunit amino acid transport system ATPase component